MLKLKLSQTEEGFTLLETLVAMLVATTFVAATMQAMVIAAYSRVRAQETSEATVLIQEDLENLRYIASQISYDESKCNASSETEGFADAIREQDSNYSGDDPTYRFTATGSDSGKEYIIIKSLTPSDEPPHNVLEVKYNAMPKSSGDGGSVAEMYTEVIPDAAFEC